MSKCPTCSGPTPDKEEEKPPRLFTWILTNPNTTIWLKSPTYDDVKETLANEYQGHRGARFYVFVEDDYYQHKFEFVGALELSEPPPIIVNDLDKAILF